MDFAQLEMFISKKMRMTHVYQPLMLKTMLESTDNSATVEQIARAFLNNDDSQLNYYKTIVKRWPHITLRKHNVVRYDKGTYTLLLDGAITDQQRRRLVELCEIKLQKFVDSDPWIKKFRELDSRAVSGSLKYEVYAKTKGRCAACGIPNTERALDADHIVPLNRGGRTELDNLQAMCFSCNRAKRDRDDTDFIMWSKRLTYGRKVGCRLCDPRDTTSENLLARAVRDPDDACGSLVMPKRHVGGLPDMIPAERTLWLDLVSDVQERQWQQHGTDGAGGRHTVLESCPDTSHFYMRVACVR